MKFEAMVVLALKNFANIFWIISGAKEFEPIPESPY